MCASISVTSPQPHVRTTQVGTHLVRSGITCKRNASTAVAGTHDPVGADKNWILNSLPWFFFVVKFGQSKLDGLGYVDNLVESDLMHHQYSLFVLEWNPGLVRRKHTNVFAAACGTFHAVILQEVMIMFRTSPISSLRILVTRTSPFCSTRKPSSPTLWFSPSRKTPQAMVRGAWSYSSFEACCDALHFLGHEGSHFSLYTSTMSLPRNVTLPLIFHDGFMGT